MENCEAAEPPVFDERDGWRLNTTKLAIKECIGLGLKLNKQDNKWYPYSEGIPMPEGTVLEIIGTILHREDTYRDIELDVWDGTETIRIKYGIDSYKADRSARKSIDRVFGISEKNEKTIARLLRRLAADNKARGASDPKFQRYALQYERWEQGTDNGIFGKELEEGDYVKVIGYCCPQYERGLADVSMWFASNSVDMIFKAVHVDALSEEMYEVKLRELIEANGKLNFP